MKFSLAVVLAGIAVVAAAPVALDTRAPEIGSEEESPSVGHHQALRAMKTAGCRLTKTDILYQAHQLHRPQEASH